MNEQLEVLMYPDYRSSNYYQRLLENELSKLNVQVIYPKDKFIPFIFTKNILKCKVDVVHLHWINPFVSQNTFKFLILLSVLLFDTLIIKYLFKKEIVWTVHNTFTHECKHPRLELIERKYLAFISKYIFCHSISAKKEISNEYGINPSKIQVITHGNYIGCYNNTINKDESRNFLNLNSDDIIYLFFGQIRPYKGIEDLIESFNILNEHKAKLLIVGKSKDDGIEKWINSKSKENENIVTKLEFIPDDEVQIYMNASDVVVLPLKKILTSGSAILALSFGKAIVAPAISSLRELLDEKGSILYDSEDEEGLIRAMRNLLDSDLEQMGEQNLELAKNLSWHQSAQKTYYVYQSCISKLN